MSAFEFGLDHLQIQAMVARLTRNQVLARFGEPSERTMNVWGECCRFRFGSRKNVILEIWFKGEQTDGCQVLMEAADDADAVVVEVTDKKKLPFAYRPVLVCMPAVEAARAEGLAVEVLKPLRLPAGRGWAIQWTDTLGSRTWYWDGKNTEEIWALLKEGKVVRITQGPFSSGWAAADHLEDVWEMYQDD